MSRDDLERFRREIDDIDKQWVRVLSRRFAVTEAVGELKRRERLPAADPQREDRQVLALRAYGEEQDVDPDLVEAVFRLITERVRRRHRELRED